MASPAARKPLPDLVYEARVNAGFTSTRSFARAVAEELHVPMETARAELTKVQNGQRGLSDRYVRAVSKLTGVPMTEFRRAQQQPDPLARLEEKVDRLLELLEALHRQRRAGRTKR